MGQLASTEARLEEIDERLLPAARQRMRELAPAARAEKEAGEPPAPGSMQALFEAAHWYVLQLSEEAHALTLRKVAVDTWQLFDLPPMPKQTPPWEEVEAATRVAAPSTPSASGGPGRTRPGSSSDEAAEPADDMHRSETAQLLPGSAGPSALGLRLRQTPG